MNKFKANTITETREIFAEELKTARLKKNISVDIAAKETGINKRYIIAMEAGNFHLLPKGIYEKKIVKEYTNFLGIRNRTKTIFKEVSSDFKNNKNTDPFYRQALKKVYFLTIPKLAKVLIILLIITCCFFYLGFYLNRITSLPYLEINNPAKDFTFTETLIKIQGRTDPSAEVTINNELVLKNTDGSFNKDLFLKIGINTISISAQKKYSQPKTIIRKIIVMPKN